MNYCRIMRASRSHLLKRAFTTVTAPALAGVENSVIWKRDIATVVSPAAISIKANDLSKIPKPKMFEKLQDRIEKEAYRTVEETLNTSNKEDGVSITQADLFGWAKRLDEDGKHQHAYEIIEWIKRKKMTLSPSELATFVVANGVKAAKTPREKKKMMFEELKDLSATGGAVEETLNAFTTMEKEYGVSITKTDLVSWSILIDRYGRPEISVQIFEWMERQKMKFTPSQLATFVDYIDRVHGLSAALGYFESVDPDFDNMDYNAKNWPAYDFLARSMSRNSKSRPW